MKEQGEFERTRDAEWEREQQRIRRQSFIESLMPLLQWVTGAGIFAIFAWMIIEAINGLAD